MPGLFPLSLLARFSADGRVYHAFGHYIAAGAGRLLLVPASLAYRERDGSAPQVIPGCPVPVEDISVLLDVPQEVPAALRSHDPLFRLLMTFADSGWRYDFIATSAGARRRVLRVTNENGIRYAEVAR